MSDSPGNAPAEVRVASATPPMGWNSWDCYGTTVTEAEVLANAEFMATRLAHAGWDTVVVDIQWHDPAAAAGAYNSNAPLILDEFGRPMPAPNRFPSAAGGQGFAPLAKQVHDLGLRFGVHVMRGVPRLAVERKLPLLGTEGTVADIADPSSTCDWNGDNVGINHEHPGAHAYYESLLALFALWGVDFVKVDDMLGPYHLAEITAFSQAARGCGRPMVLSLSPGRALALERAGHLAENADMWRVSDDLWDRWEDVEAQFARMASWAPFAGPGHWPDADMLPLGHIGIRADRGVDRCSLLTPDEQRTLMTLWCISRSPLMFGGDLPTSSEETISLLTNMGALDVQKYSSGNRQLLREGAAVIWVAQADDRPGHYLALFNLSAGPADIRLSDGEWGPGPGDEVLDLWQGDVASGHIPFVRSLPAHGAALLHVRPARPV